MRYDLTTLARRTRNPRRKSITIRDIQPPAMLASDLYQAAYAPIVALWTRQAARIAAEYERSLSSLTTDSPVDLQALLEEGASEFSRLFALLTSSLQSWSVNVERWHRGKWRGAVLSASGVDIGTLIGPENARETLGQYVEWNTALIKDVSAQAQQRIGTAVFAGLTQRKPAREVAVEVREAVAMTRRRSIGIASDQLSKLTSALADERRREAGLDVWEWKHSGKKHPRVSHQHRNGHYYSEAKARVGTVVDGKTVEAEPDASDLPGRPPWCGCRSLSVLIFD